MNVLLLSRCLLRRRSILVGLAAAAAASLEPAAADAAASVPAPGLLVEEVAAGSTARAAGLLPGDVLLSWQRDFAGAAGLPASGELALPFDWVEVYLEQVPRARVTLLGRRGSAAASWTLPAGAPADWERLRTAPVLSGDLQARYGESRARLAAGAVEEGAALLRAAAAGARTRGDERLAAWFLAEAARELARSLRWGEADSLYSEALALEAVRREPGLAGQLYREWGELFLSRYAWARADECFERALAADRDRPFESLSSAWSLAGLGLADTRGRGPRAEDDLLLEALELRRRLAPGSADEARIWLYRSLVPAVQLDFETASQHLQRAAEMLSGRSDGRLLLAEVLANLAVAQVQLARFEPARESWRRAEALLREEAPDDPMMAGIRQGLGLIALREGDLERAEEHLSHSLAVYRRRRPGSVDEADALRELGLVLIQAGKTEAGSRHLCEALAGVEAWRQKLQRSQETRNAWGRATADYYRDCADSLILLGRQEEAFLAIETGRARAFLDLRAERDLRRPALSPARSREWRRLDAEYEQIQRELEVRNASEDSSLEQIVNLEGGLRAIHRQKERLIERDLPLGAIRYPEPLSLAEARRRLEPGSVLLLYSVGSARTLLFVVTPEGAAPGWTVLTLEVSGADLRKRVQFFRDTLVRDRLNRQAAAAQARALYDLLVRPAEPYLAGAERVVLAPDGPLHTLPFAALVRDGRHLVEWKPLHFTLSATAYADTLAGRSSAAEPVSRLPRLVAFGDPLYVSRPASPEAAAGDLAARQVLGQEVSRLPATRQEAEAVAGLFPGARVVLGDQATQETVTGAVRGASHVHFAVHGVLDERMPLNSALVLAPSGRPGEGEENGLLQAWEVMESLPLDADLAILSACDTALGREFGGEGLVGLTRAFQYAGARSVIATLWGISDFSTAGFMKELYGALLAGKTKDEALRIAQIAQIRSDRPQPFYWAAFQLFGDWR
jgi:CHAT domain-containing protein